MATELATAGSGSIQKSGGDATALESLKAWASTFQGDSERVPAKIARLVPSALIAARARLAPADPRVLAIEIDALLTWARTFNVPFDEPREVARFYREGLASVPGDLLALAMRRARAAHKYGMRLPLPAEIAATIEPEMVERRLLVSKLFRAKLAPVDYDSGERDERRESEVRRLVSQAKRTLVSDPEDAA